MSALPAAIFAVFLAETEINRQERRIIRVIDEMTDTERLDYSLLYLVILDENDDLVLNSRQLPLQMLGNVLRNVQRHLCR